MWVCTNKRSASTVSLKAMGKLAEAMDRVPGRCHSRHDRQVSQISGTNLIVVSGTPAARSTRVIVWLLACHQRTCRRLRVRRRAPSLPALRIRNAELMSNVVQSSTASACPSASLNVFRRRAAASSSGTSGAASPEAGGALPEEDEGSGTSSSSGIWRRDAVGSSVVRGRGSSRAGSLPKFPMVVRLLADAHLQSGCSRVCLTSERGAAATHPGHLDQSAFGTSGCLH